MGVKERLIEFLEWKDNLSQAKFEAATGLSNGFVNNIGDTIRSSSISKIRGKFPELNISWVLTGEGEMLNGTKQKISLDQALSDILANQDAIIASQQVLISSVADILAHQRGTPSKIQRESLQGSVEKARGDRLKARKSQS